MQTILSTVLLVAVFVVGAGAAGGNALANGDRVGNGLEGSPSQLSNGGHGGGSGVGHGGGNG
ncbi:hypothetical protein GCM10012319_52300 [Comamonas sp. KCTC 72670]|nr:hypothetical protein GCM10012319_52300 [Comamonas sp. KCTC 72670]